MDKVLADYDALTDKIDGYRRKVSEAQDAEQRTKDSAKGYVEQQISVLEEQAAHLQKLKGLRDDEAKKAQEAQEAINRGKEKEIDLAAQLTEAQNEEARAALDSEIELQKAKVDKYKAEFDGLEKVSEAALRAAAGQRPMQSQGEFLQKARRAVAAQNMKAGLYDPRFAAENKDVATRELDRRENETREKAKLNAMQEQRKALDPDQAQKARDRQQKIKHEQIKNTEEMGDNAAKKADAERKAANYGGQLANAETAFRAAGKALTEIAAAIDNEAVPRLLRVAVSWQEGNAKLATETDIFMKLIEAIPAGVAGYNKAMADARQNTENAQASAGYNAPYLTQKRATDFSEQAGKEIDTWQRESGDQMTDAEREKIQSDPTAFKYFRDQVEWTKQTHGMKGGVIKKDKDWNKHTGNFHANLGGIRAAPAINANAVLSARTVNTASLAKAQGGILESIDRGIKDLGKNATIVRTDGGR
jgi:hypothetical protein